MNAEQLASLQPALSAWVQSFRPCFKRAVTFGYFQSYLLGLMADLRRKSVEPIALACGIAVRTLQEFLSMFAWDHERLERMLLHRVADRCPAGGIGVVDATGHPKQGDKTPGVQRQYCGESGKIENCVVAQHLLFTDNDAKNPFSCVLASDLYLPQKWADDRGRCDEAGIAPELACRPKWKIAVGQVKQGWPAACSSTGWSSMKSTGWFRRSGSRWTSWDSGEWAKCRPTSAPGSDVPACNSGGYACHAARRVDNLTTHSPAFVSQSWKRCKVKQTTRGRLIWEYKAARVHLSDSSHANHNLSVPTDRMYWLIVMRQPKTGEIKYVISNAGESVGVAELIRALLSRWHVEKWFEHAKQDAGLGDFEVRTYLSLIRHWLCVRLAMCFLSEQTTRLRGEKCADHLRTDLPGRLDAGGEGLAAGLEVMVAVNAAMCVLPRT